ncbi:PREDICTED: RPII140-upstream gene protein [Dinoponera quadriceps]|uniref:Complex I assembly factor TIMMDC1, mitochondrial n=1 Tax=Dinoponera quadriceps TaxID=609295 RepID=A0A6P3XD94_DINQU|nr:PREDICTED: RPII140-upstream gene protein [Dinoponera quadriceps]
MIRSMLPLRGPILVATVYPFNTGSDNQYDKPVNKIIKPLIEDEYGWDRIKKIFKLNEEGMFTKELQSIINITVAGSFTGMVIGGILVSKNTVNNFISNNEATKFASHFEAKRQLQRQVILSFWKNGLVMARKLGLFCLLYSTITTCTTAYRGKLRIENYILGGSITGFLNRLNLGLRASLVGASLGGTLGGICGGISIFLLYLTGTNIDEIMQVHYDWINSMKERENEQIRAYMAAKEDLNEKKLFEMNRDTQLAKQRFQETTEKIEDPDA